MPLSKAEVPSDSPSLLGADRLRGLRWILIGAELILVVVTDRLLGLRVEREPVLVICAAQALFNIAAGRWLQHPRLPGPPTLLAHLLVDVAALTAVVHFAGGATNPLVILYLPLIAIAATALSPSGAVVVTIVCIACNTGVSLLEGDTILQAHDHERAFRVHLFGMWLVFVCASGIIAWFIVRLAEAIRRRDAALAAARESALRGERIVALANLAASAAHELGTPLSTIAVVAGELARDAGLSSETRADVDLVLSQALRCRAIITDLVERAGERRLEQLSSVLAREWLSSAVGRWRLLWPKVDVAMRFDPAVADARLLADASLEHALCSVLNNATEACAGADPIDVALRDDGGRLAIDVLDRGTGIARDVAGRLGREPVSTRGAGRGMGLLLACHAVERLGGKLTFHDRDGGGTIARICLTPVGTSL